MDSADNSRAFLFGRVGFELFELRGKSLAAAWC